KSKAKTDGKQVPRTTPILITDGHLPRIQAFAGKKSHLHSAQLTYAFVVHSWAPPNSGEVCFRGYHVFNQKTAGKRAFHYTYMGNSFSANPVRLLTTFLGKEETSL
ncbi:unnamed protein product, partial [Ilex paraguariensis]